MNNKIISRPKVLFFIKSIIADEMNQVAKYVKNVWHLKFSTSVVQLLPIA